jgi:hypothetical protein
VFESRWFALLWLAIAMVYSGYMALCVAVLENHHEDLFIYSSGAAIGFRHESPYDTERIRARVAGQYPENAILIDNCGYFLAPQAMLVFAPTLPFPWATAKILWCLGTVGLGAVAGWYLLSAFGKPPMPRWLPSVVAFTVLCNPMGILALVFGQTSLFFFGCVVLGQVVYRRGWHWLGNLIWALAFIKPHLALPLLLLAWYADGWKRAFGIAMWVLVLNVVAGLATTGNPLILAEYVRYLGEGHGTVKFNRITANPHISSWNRLLFTLGGTAVELGAVGTIASYAVWFGVCAARSAIRLVKPSLAWALAAVGCGIPLCCQTLPYELPVLILILPWVIESLRSSYRPIPILAIFFASMVLQLGGSGSIFDDFAKFTGSPLIHRLMESHQSFFVALLAAIFSGSAKPTIASASGSSSPSVPPAAATGSAPHP